MYPRVLAVMALAGLLSALAACDKEASYPANAPGDEDVTVRDPWAASDPRESVKMTEFAALDTDSNGMLAKSEWSSDAAAGMPFDEADADGNGGVDQREFRAATTQSEPEPSVNLDPVRENDAPDLPN